jgi:hypothetical protein
MSVLDEVREAMRLIEESRRTVVVRPGLGDRIRDHIPPDWMVIESGLVPPGRAYVMKVPT